MREIQELTTHPEQIAKLNKMRKYLVKKLEYYPAELLNRIEYWNCYEGQATVYRAISEVTDPIIIDNLINFLRNERHQRTLTGR